MEEKDEINKLLAKDEENIKTWTVAEVVEWAKEILGGPATKLFKAIQTLKTSVPQGQSIKASRLWRALLDGNVETTEGLVTVIKLPQGIEWMTEESSLLFIRKCDQDLFDIVKKLFVNKPKQGIVITGNPGIGKSWFLSYCLLKFAKEKKTVFYESVGSNISYLFKPDGTVQVFNPAISYGLPPETMDDGNTVYLFDPSSKDSREPRFPAAAFTIVTASPNQKHYTQFNRRIGNKKYYMSCWTWDETVSILKHLPSLKEDTVKKHFDKYGGIPRYILTETDDWDEELNRAIAKANLDDLQKSVGGLDLLPYASHLLLHHVVDASSNYRHCTIRFASPYVAYQIATRLLVNEEKEFVRFLKTVTFPDLASVRGSLFEKYAHKVLQGKGTYDIRSLSTSKVTTLELINNNELVVVETEEELCTLHLKEGIYYKPKVTNFSALDSISKVQNTIILFQMTVSYKHPVIHAALKNHISALGFNNNTQDIKLFFVVPPDRFLDFHQQSYLNTNGNVITDPVHLNPIVKSIEQWVLKLPLDWGVN